MATNDNNNNKNKKKKENDLLIDFSDDDGDVDAAVPAQSEDEAAVHELLYGCDVSLGELAIGDGDDVDDGGDPLYGGLLLPKAASSPLSASASSSPSGRILCKTLRLQGSSTGSRVFVKPLPSEMNG